MIGLANRTNTWASTALALFNCDSLQSFWVHWSLLSDCTGL
jgi:hypothetical protein